MENWLGEVETMMKVSVREQLKNSLEDYKVTERTDWTQKWPGTPPLQYPLLFALDV